jgi:urease accessory protein
MSADSEPIRPLPPASPELALLQLLHLADSALPIGALAHSFGLESLVSNGLLPVRELEEFLRGYLEETGMVESVFCREGFRIACTWESERSLVRWCEINEQLHAMKPARESRAGSVALGRNFLSAVSALEDFSIVRSALEASAPASGSQASVIEHSPAFGLAGGVLGLDEENVVLAYLHQVAASLISACQRLLPLGQSAATRILWSLKPKIIEAATRSASSSIGDVCCFNPLLDWGAMEHPALSTRLFIS